MTFDPGPDSAFADYTSDDKPVTPKARPKQHLSPGALRAIRRASRAADERRDAAEELRRRREVRQQEIDVRDATP
jgi:hypothetical protein